MITWRGRPIVALITRGAKTSKRRIDLAWLRKRTESIPYQQEDSVTLVRRMRDSYRY